MNTNQLNEWVHFALITAIFRKKTDTCFTGKLAKFKRPYNWF